MLLILITDPVAFVVKYRAFKLLDQFGCRFLFNSGSARNLKYTKSVLDCF